MLKQITRVSTHMMSLGFFPLRKVAKYYYALMLDHGLVHAPQSLRGTKRDPVSGFSWKRKFEFIVKHRYGIKVGDIARALNKVSYLIADGVSSYTVSLGCGLVSVKVHINSNEKTILACVPASS